MEKKEITTSLREIFAQIPRRHNPDNVKEMYRLLDEYENQLQSIEKISPDFELAVAPHFEGLDPIRALVKKSSDNKASKKMKDDYFDQASGDFKDGVDAVISLLDTAPDE